MVFNKLYYKELVSYAQSIAIGGSNIDVALGNWQCINRGHYTSFLFKWMIFAYFLEVVCKEHRVYDMWLMIMKMHLRQTYINWPSCLNEWYFPIA